MKARHGAAALLASTTLVLAATGTASAATPGGSTCSGGTLESGTYSSVTVTDSCTVADGAAVTVLRNVLVAPGATFDASTHSTLHVGGNVLAGAGSMVALGCTFAHPCDDEQPGEVGADTVDGNVVLSQVFDAAINGVTIGGNLTSHGGGPGYTMDPWIPFSVKDNTIRGNLTVTGLRTTWFGVIRTTVGGTVVLVDIQAADPDGNEVVANTIGGNLVCQGNSPTPQLGDAVEDGPPGYGPNTVGGRAVGQCAGAIIG